MSRKCPKKMHLFLNWLKANRNRFRHEPRIVRQRRNFIELCFTGISNAIHVGFNPNSGMIVSVHFQGECVDLLGDFDVAVRKSREGYFCALCYEEKRDYYPTRDELWIQHGFETFLEWSNSDLAESKWLEIEMGCGTSARLHKEKPPVSVKSGNTRQYSVELHVK